MDSNKHQESGLASGTYRLGFDAPGVYAVAIHFARKNRQGLRKAIADVRYLERQMWWECCGVRQSGMVFEMVDIEKLYELSRHCPWDELCQAVEERFLAFRPVCTVCGKSGQLATCTSGAEVHA